MDSRITELSNRVSEIQGMCKKLQNNTENMEISISNIKNSIGKDHPPSGQSQKLYFGYFNIYFINYETIRNLNPK